MKRWVGRWLMGIAAIHTAFAVAVFGEVLASIVKRGVFNTVGADPTTAAVVWFVLFGVMLFVCGLAVAELEASSPNRLPRSIGWGLLAMAVVGITLMPASGFWLVFPPAIALLVKKSKAKLAAAEI